MQAPMKEVATCKRRSFAAQYQSRPVDGESLWESLYLVVSNNGNGQSSMNSTALNAVRHPSTYHFRRLAVWAPGSMPNEQWFPRSRFCARIRQIQTSLVLYTDGRVTHRSRGISKANHMSHKEEKTQQQHRVDNANGGLIKVWCSQGFRPSSAASHMIPLTSCLP
jgi:hypothetical protein